MLEGCFFTRLSVVQCWNSCTVFECLFLRTIREKYQLHSVWKLCRFRNDSCWVFELLHCVGRDSKCTKKMFVSSIWRIPFVVKTQLAIWSHIVKTIKSKALGELEFLPCNWKKQTLCYLAVATENTCLDLKCWDMLGAFYIEYVL